MLSAWEGELDRACLSRSQHPVFVALIETIERFRLPVQLFHDLLTAFRSDVTTRRYETFEEVLAYCRCSANPVGRLLLRLFEYDARGLDERSDDICTALQLANFWQDLTIDLAKNRVYIPLEDLRRFAYPIDQLFGHAYNERFVAVLRHQIQRTRQLFQRGRPLCDLVEGRLSLELRAVWLGGMRILEKIERSRYHVFRARPAITLADKGALLGKLLTWSHGAEACRP